jgi:sec-independent protein translocase protein TatC
MKPPILKTIHASMNENETFAPFWGHLEELRLTLLRILLIIMTTAAICFVNYEIILSSLTKPLPSGYELVLLSPLEGILIALKTSFWTGLFISSPVWLYVLSRFILPGLKKHEKSLILPFIAASAIFTLIGCLFAYFITIPIANQYLINFNQNIGTNLWSLGNYLDYSLFLLMANGIAFELGVIGIFAVHLQVLTAEKLTQNRRFAIVSAFIISAILTPPDILTQFLLAIPLIALYETLILYARFTKLKTRA